jgi:hypothetical protein
MQHPKAKKKKRQRKKSTINMREANKFFADQAKKKKRLTKSERHVDGMKLPALRHYLTSTMDAINRETLQEAMRVLIAGMRTKVGRECASVFLAYEEEEDEVEDEVEGEAEDEVEDEVEGEVEDEVEGEVEDEVEGEVEDEVEGEVEDEVEDEVEGEVEDEVEGEADGEEDDTIWYNPDWIKSRSSRSGYTGVTPDRGLWKCTVGGKTVGRFDTIAEACDMYLKEWTRARFVD